MAEEKLPKNVDDVLPGLDPAKRRFLKALVAGAGFGVPLVASFSMKGISTYTVHAQAASNLVQ